MPRHWPPCCKSVGLIFWSRDHKDISIKLSEINSHSNPRLPIDANQIKWFKTHILFLDFDWCPIEVMLTLHFKWTSIGSLGWIAWPPCKASILTMGWVEKILTPLMIRTQNCSNGPQSYTSSFILGLWTFLSCSIWRSNHSLHEHEVLFRFITKAMLILDFSEIFWCA